MQPPGRIGWLAAAVLCLLLVLAGRVEAGGGPQNWLVVYDPSDPHAVSIARHYQSLRQIPETHLLPYAFPQKKALANGTSLDRMMTTGETWAFVSAVRSVIAARGLENQIDGIAFAGQAPMVFDPDSTSGSGDARSLNTAIMFSPNASQASDLDSLTAGTNGVFRGPSGGDSGTLLPTTRVTSSALFGGQRYLMSTHLGYTGPKGLRPEEVFALLERSAASDGTKPVATFYWALNSDVRSTTRADQIAITTPEWDALGLPYWIEGQGSGGVSGSVRMVTGRIGGLGSAPISSRAVAGQIAGYSTLDVQGAGNLYAPGAISEHLTSYGGVLGGLLNVSQTALTEWLRWGACGSTGTVVEPYALWEKFPHARMHSHYFRGATFAEAVVQSVKNPVELMVAGDPLMQPYANIPEVEITSPGSDAVISGVVNILATATYTVPMDHDWDLVIDGRVVAIGSPGESVVASRIAGGFSLDTTTLTDGWHEIRIVVRTDDAIASQGFDRVPVRVNNSGASVTLTAPAMADFRGNLNVSASPLGVTGATAIEIRSAGQVLATLGAGGGSANFPARKLGYVPTARLFAVAVTPGGEISSAPVSVGLEWADRASDPTAVTTPGVLAQARIFSNAPANFDWAGTPDVVVPVTDRNRLSYKTLADFGMFTTSVSTNKAGVEFVTWFLAEESGYYDFAFHGSFLEASLLIDGQEIISPVVPSTVEVAQGGDRLAAGWHELRFRVRITGNNANFDLTYRSRNSRFFDRYDFAPLETDVCAAPPTVAPALSGRADSASQATLFWNDNTASETGWKVERFLGAPAASLSAYTGNKTAPTLHQPFTQDSLRAGGLVANDLTDTWVRVPSYLSNGVRLLAADADRTNNATTANLYQVWLPAGTTLYAVLHPSSATPAWMTAQGGWTKQAATENLDSRETNGWELWKRTVTVSDGIVNLGQCGVAYGGAVSFVFVFDPAWTTVATAAANASSHVVTGLLSGPQRFRVSPQFANGTFGLPFSAIADTGQTASNSPPIVDAGADQSVAGTGAPVSLAGGGAYDGTLSFIWSRDSGPGSVAFGNASSASTTVTLGSVGVHVLRLTASDGAQSASDTVTLTVLPGALGNTPPTANAGPDQVINLSLTAQLAGSAGDDGLPNPPSGLSVSWAQVSGPAPASIQDPTSTNPRVIFPKAGTYDFAFSASDGVATTSDLMRITVAPDPNQPPVANAGTDFSAIIGQSTSLIGSATDDGGPSAVTYRWSQLSGPATATISSPTSSTSAVNFPTNGVYVFQLMADDGAQRTFDTVRVSATYDPAGNSAPVVDIGPASVDAIFHDTVEVAHTFSDDGLPSPPASLVLSWSVVSGPGVVRSFVAPDRSKTWLRVTEPGTYMLRLSVDDGATTSSDDLELRVSELASKRITWFWGSQSPSSVGMSGDLSADTNLYPTAVARNLVKALGSSTGTIALDRDGRVWTLGTNSDGQLGDPDWASTGRKVFLEVPGLSDIVDIGQGGNFRLAVKADGTLWTWGINSSGQLGLGTTSSTDVLVPTQVSGLSGVEEVECGSSFTIARLSDGTVRTWGSGTNNRLGNNSTATQPTPQDLGLTNVTAVAAGQAFGLALLADGSVKAWGLNSSGQIGNNSTTTAPVPTDVLNAAGTAPLSGIQSIAAGLTFALALDDQGRVWGWGGGGSGQLGQGNLLNSSLPKQISGLPSEIVAITAAGSAAFALDAQGRLWGCGSNSNQLLARPVESVSYVTSAALVPGVPTLSQIVGSQGHNSVFGVTPGGTYADFAADRFTPSQLADAAVSGPGSDPDGDGLVNRLENVLGWDPLARNTTHPVAVRLGETGDEVSFSFRLSVVQDDLAIRIRESSDLRNWVDASPSTWVETDGGDTRSFELTYPPSARRFLRIEVDPAD